MRSVPHQAARVSADDLMSLAAERGSTPMQVGAVLMLEAAAALDERKVADALLTRVQAVPRLRQRLVKLPPGCGRPVWVDDPAFTVTDHLSVVRCASTCSESAVLAIAAEALAARLPRDRALWAATLVTDHDSRAVALVVVFHHVLADGIGGLAVLAALVDGADVAGDVWFPRPMPALGWLAVDAAKDRLRSIAALPAGLGRLRGAILALRPVLGRSLGRSSLNRPTGPRRQLALVRTNVSQVHTAARAHQATVNDATLVAVAAALHDLLATRGEHLDEFVISVPFSARDRADTHDLGNRSGVVPVRVPAVGDLGRRLSSLAATTRAAKHGRRAASNALLGPVFRLLASAGLYRRFIDRQRLIHTFVSNLHGPEGRLTFLGCPITSIIPLSSSTGNVTVSFAVLSYAGELTITLIADPATCPDLPTLRDALQSQLHLLTASAELPDTAREAPASTG